VTDYLVENRILYHSFLCLMFWLTLISWNVWNTF